MLPDFFHLIIQAPFFKAHLWRNKVGAEGRKEVKLDFFESELIPVPPLATQQSIVALWQATQNRNAAALKAADEHEVYVRRMFLEKLGLSAGRAGPSPRVFAARWRDIEAWNCKAVHLRLSQADMHKGRYPVVRPFFKSSFVIKEFLVCKPI
jgi:hypothetical protein